MTRLVIVGTGALGSLFASRLTRTDPDLTAFGHWQAHIDHVNEHGLTVEELNGDHTTHRYRMTDNVREVPPADFVLVLVKATQTKRAAAEIAQFIKPTGTILTLQNGLGNVEALLDANPGATILAGTTPIGATMLGPGHVRHAGDGSISLRPQDQQWITTFRAAGFSVDTHPKLGSLIWGKLVINAGINAPTAILGKPNGFLATDSEAKALMQEAALEAAMVAHSFGIKLPYSDPAAKILQVAQMTAANRSSMLQDIERGVQTEVDAINGEIVRLGRQQEIPTPINERLLSQVKQLEAEL